ncbi:MAG: endonuclease/exonuclease/phosphatase family protein [Mariniblastus sp.]|nr:endonuclease/exonuclease/phosphatase family protein [Mariniblastus sp.]
MMPQSKRSLKTDLTSRKSWLATCSGALRIVFSIVFVLNAGSGEAVAQQTAPNKSTNLRVMSFNIRNGRANDGDNSWKHRKEFAADIIRDAKLDVVGLQEAFRFQLDDLRKQLPEFEEAGEGRDGGEKGEYSAILFRGDRFTKLESGTFWLSDTPEVKSRHWGNRYLRVCTWVRLKVNKTSQCFYVYNTHFDHQSQNARMKSSQLIAKRISTREHQDPFLVTGDFNADESNPVILYLKGKSTQLPASPIQVVDSFRKLHPNEKMVGTGGGFEGRSDGKKIDYVFVQPNVNVIQASIIRTNREGKFPSDHSPVMAELRLSTNQHNDR